MTEDLSTRQTKFVTYLVYVLLALLTISAGGAWVLIANTFSEQAAQREAFNRFKETLPEKYVRLERYTCDQERIENLLIRIDRKIDRMNGHGGDR